MTGDLKDRLRDTTQHMAAFAHVDMSLWNDHSNACLEAADRIDALEKQAERLRGALEAIHEYCDGLRTNGDKSVGLYCLKHEARAALNGDGHD